ncbi:MAG: glycosyltransferase family 2 protein, partial [Gemmatimonadaceae bacterium]
MRDAEGGSDSAALARRTVHEEASAPRVGVVVLNWNGAADTERCLASLYAARPRPAAVVLVDNASRGGETERLRAWIAHTAARDGWRWVEREDDGEAHDGGAIDGDATPAPWLVFHRLTTQRGFSGGNNAGVRTLLALSRPTHILLLNNDTEVAPDYFAALAGALGSTPAAVLLSGTINEMDRRDRVWYAGGRVLPSRALVLHHYEVPSDPAPR